MLRRSNVCEEMGIELAHSNGGYCLLILWPASSHCLLSIGFLGCNFHLFHLNITPEDSLCGEENLLFFSLMLSFISSLFTGMQSPAGYYKKNQRPNVALSKREGYKSHCAV